MKTSFGRLVDVTKGEPVALYQELGGTPELPCTDDEDFAKRDPVTQQPIPC